MHTHMRTTDTRPLDEVYDVPALVKTLQTAHLNLADSLTDWFRLAYAMADAGLDEEDFLILSAEAGEKYRYKENHSLYASALRKAKSTDSRGIRCLLGMAKAHGIDIRRFYKPPENYGQTITKTKTNIRHSKPQSTSMTTEPYPLHIQHLGELGSRLVDAYYHSEHPNAFLSALTGNGILTQEQMEHACRLYRLGRARNGSIVFWQIDEQQRVRDGKLMHYGPDAHRLKDPNHHASWVSFKLKNTLGADGQPLLSAGWNASRCLFGQHLLDGSGNRPVAIVESEKTAVICSELMHSHDYLWMATGGLSSLKAETLRPLEGRTVVVFPDTDPSGQTFGEWKAVCRRAMATLAIDLRIMDILERCATPEQKARKIDIADFLLES